MSDNLFHLKRYPSDHWTSSVDFTSKLQFEAGLNLFRSRSHTCVQSRQGHSFTETPSNLNSSSVFPDQWNVPTIDFTLHRIESKTSARLKAKEALGHTAERRLKKETQFVRKPMPKIIECPKNTGINKNPFLTRFRAPRAGTAKRVNAKYGVLPAGPFKPVGPHAFRGDDFRPVDEEKLRHKPRFITSFSSDPAGLELKRKSISVHEKNPDPVISTNQTNCGENKFICKPFITSLSLRSKPKWDRGLVLPKEAYRRGISEDQIRMNRIMKQLSWCSEKEKVPNLDRPDIRDYKTVDWLHVTRHPKEEKTILR